MSRFVYSLFAWGLLLAGLAYSIYPAAMFGFTLDIIPQTATLTDMRATYGGLQVAFGLYLLSLRKTPQRRQQGFSLVAYGLCVVGLVRVAGVLLDGGEQGLNSIAAAVELSLAGLAYYYSRESGVAVSEKSAAV